MAKLKTGRHTSAIKAQRQAEKRTSKEDLKKAESCIDKAAKKSVMHWKTAARKKSRLAKAANKAAAK